MNRIAIRSSSATRHLHALQKEAIKPPPSLGRLTPSSGDAYSHSITPLSNNIREFETKSNNITKKFIFHKSKITQLKAMASVGGVHNPTPIQVLTALISNCAKVAAAPESSSRPPLFHLLDKRPKMTSQLPKTCVGDLRAIKDRIVKRKMELELYKENLRGDEIVNAIKDMVVLKDAPNGESIEALITLEERCMATFQQDKQLLQFGSL